MSALSGKPTSEHLGFSSAYGAAGSNAVTDDFKKRQTSLIVGEHYRVLRNAPSFPDGLDFKAGEVLVLNAFGYSHYDECWVYKFQTESKAPKSFW